jgi:hypothetical protein
MSPSSIGRRKIISIGWQRWRTIWSAVALPRFLPRSMSTDPRSKGREPGYSYRLLHGRGTPVLSGVVASLSRPGGNITGVTILAGELFGKNLSLLHECCRQPRPWVIFGTPPTPVLPVQLLILDASMPPIAD